MKQVCVEVIVQMLGCQFKVDELKNIEDWIKEVVCDVYWKNVREGKIGIFDVQMYMEVVEFVCQCVVYDVYKKCQCVVQNVLVISRVIDIFDVNILLEQQIFVNLQQFIFVGCCMKIFGKDFDINVIFVEELVIGVYQDWLCQFSVEMFKVGDDV